MTDVKVWEENVVIPTYPVGQPEKNPMFLEKRVYQGSSGVVYPHAVIEKIHDEKVDKTYKAVFLENEYIKVMVLPELGGRIQMAFDKVKQRHFVYYNQVIKPALVGLTGPWISGGIEFNWPQHHRPSTFEPIDYTIRENEDGSKTVWVNEVERMFRTKGLVAFTLYPHKAYIEITGKLYNRTPVPQTFLWWANPAVKVNDHYQSVFPPDVYAVYDHGKRDVSSFPVARGVYYKVDYSPGTDISRYKNIPVPTSYMAINSRYNFIGGYEHDTRGGLLHVANHHISPGKKQWTWGHAEFGRAWDRNLTDEDGPYIELMTGVYTDNQPDFSWLQPYEEKSFVQYFMPYQEVGVVKNATKEAVVNMEVNDKSVVDIRLYVTAPFTAVRISLTENGVERYCETAAVAPEAPYLRTIALEQQVREEQLRLVVTDLEGGRTIITCQPEVFAEKEIPPAAQAAKLPAEVENNEQLYLTGLHLEQYRHATYSAKDYYEEALRRDPGDVRCNNALGLWYFKRGKFAVAETFFKKAVATLTKRNPNPYDGEPYYNLGMALWMQDRPDEAFDAFYKCVWNDACQHAGYLNLARIASSKGHFEEALELIDKSLVKNAHSHTARHAKTFILRKLGREEEALQVIEASLELDPFNFGCLFERYLLMKPLDEQSAAETLKQLVHLSRNWVHNFIEYAFDYAHAGLNEEAAALLAVHLDAGGKEYPMVYYYMGWFAVKRGLSEQAVHHFQKASLLDPAYCFPNRIEDVPVLQTAMALCPIDARAPYYLGNFWYDKRQYEEAIKCWEASAKADDRFPTVHRNLSLAYFNKKGDPAQALAFMERAFSLDPKDARVLMELDQLYKRLNTPHRQRLELLERYPELVLSRDDLYLERVTLYNMLGKYNKAKALLAAHQFHPWEGGEGKVVYQHLICHTELAKQAIEEGEYGQALQLLEEAEHYPDNLGEGKLPGVQENDIYYLKGLALEHMGDEAESRRSFQLATRGISEPVQAIFYNDPQPDKIVYQGLGWQKLGEGKKAKELFQRLVDFGRQHMDDVISIDYFAVSLPDLLVFDVDLDLRNKVHCLYLVALGNLGLELDRVGIESGFDEVLKLDGNHQGAMVHKRMAGFLLPEVRENV